MSIYKLERKQVVNASINDCWDFFSSPKNLAVITPESMKFNIIDFDDKPIYNGMIIGYTVSPVKFCKLKWLTEITEVQKPNCFIDNQLLGPYKIWHHKHFFRELESGTEIVDVVHYVLPFAPLSNFMNLFIKKKLDFIFDYRTKKIEEIFNNKK